MAKLADTLADVTAKQDAAAQATADWVTDYENQLDDFQKKMKGTVDSLNLSDEAGKAAKDTIAEYVQKLKDGKKDAVAAAKDVAASVALALQNGSTPSVTTSTTTTVPGHAGGTTDAEDVFVAGENGPELIVGKQGSTVFPTEETDKIVDALNGMEPASDTSNEKKFDQILLLNLAQANRSSIPCWARLQTSCLARTPIWRQLTPPTLAFLEYRRSRFRPPMPPLLPRLHR